MDSIRPNKNYAHPTEGYLEFVTLVEWEILLALRKIQYGQLDVVVRDGKPVSIRKTETRPLT